MTKQENADNNLPKNLVGTKFVKLFREYLLSLIKPNKLNETDIVRKAFLEKNVKPDTTKRYLKELVEMEIVKKDDKEIYKMLMEC